MISWASFSKGLKFYLANNFIAQIPSFRIRHWYYRNVLKYKIGHDSSIHMGAFVTGDFIEIGDNVVINRNCYLDGRIGIKIGNNVNVSPEVYIVSMEHDPDSPIFATRGEQVVINDHAWIGARAIISPGIQIGEGAVLGAGAVATKDISPYKISVGIPAKEVKDRNRDLNYKSRYFPWFDTDVQRQPMSLLALRKSFIRWFKAGFVGQAIKNIYRMTLDPLGKKIFRVVDNLKKLNKFDLLENQASLQKFLKVLDLDANVENVAREGFSRFSSATLVCLFDLLDHVEKKRLLIDSELPDVEYLNCMDFPEKVTPRIEKSLNILFMCSSNK